MGGEAEPRQRLPAGPVDEGVGVDLGDKMFGRDDALGQVIDLLEIVAAGDRQLAGVPEEFERGLRRVPVPPTARLVILGFHLARHDRAALADLLVGLVEGLVEPLALPFGPVLQDARLAPHEAVLPVGKEGGRDDRGVVGPVLEERAVLFQKRGQVFRPVGLVAREEDLVMGALDGRDAVDLDEAEVVDQVVEPGLAEREMRRAGQPLPLEEDFSRLGVGERNRHGREGRGCS
ncbi:unnamed protein product [Ciceribacter selenitireducens ATCC BAA-1503]|uniref:Uncharacterized protein n=1 Tax=Ciceribacter selenitireducens ATCC BAA-1503 TaxID=1336235 RepID=A0A376AC47_9HYPH|nr:unnamed protein product [Ciceribacter selenitireducens ATCC BAA-1503]